MHPAFLPFAIDFEGNGLSIAAFGAILFAIVMGLALLGSRTNGSLYDRIGEGGLTPESEYGRRPAHVAEPDSPAARAEREQEIRQMLSARSERLVRGGKPPLDIDAEVGRLLAPQPPPRGRDDGLLDEVRQLVLARNDRRARQGLEPLDVESEVKRTLAELDP